MKKILCTLLAFWMMFSMVACGDVSVETNANSTDEEIIDNDSGTDNISTNSDEATTNTVKNSNEFPEGYSELMGIVGIGDYSNVMDEESCLNALGWYIEGVEFFSDKTTHLFSRWYDDKVTESSLSSITLNEEYSSELGCKVYDAVLDETLPCILMLLDDSIMLSIGSDSASTSFYLTYPTFVSPEISGNWNCINVLANINGETYTEKSSSTAKVANNVITIDDSEKFVLRSKGSSITESNDTVTSYDVFVENGECIPSMSVQYNENKDQLFLITTLSLSDGFAVVSYTYERVK